MLGGSTAGGRPPITTFGRRENPRCRTGTTAAGNGWAAAAEAGYRFADAAHSHDPEPLVLAAYMLTEYGPDDERRQAYDRLLPLAGTHSVVGGCASYQGAIDYHLAALAAALGWHDKASAHVAQPSPCTSGSAPRAGPPGAGWPPARGGVPARR